MGNYRGRFGFLFVAAVLFAGSVSDAAQAGVAVLIRLSQQTMSVAVNGSGRNLAGVNRPAGLSHTDWPI